MQEAKSLQLFLSTSTTKKGVVKGVIQMINPKDVGMSSSQYDVQDAQKDVETLGMREYREITYEDEQFEYEFKSCGDYAPYSL